MLIAGIVSYYKDFTEALYQLLEGQASITGKENELWLLKVLYDLDGLLIVFI